MIRAILALLLPRPVAAPVSPERVARVLDPQGWAAWSTAR